MIDYHKTIKAEDQTVQRSLEELIATAHELQNGNLKMPTKKEMIAKKPINTESGDHINNNKTKSLTPLEKELLDIRMKYDTDVTDESWAKAQSVLEMVLKELMPIKKEKEWSMEKFWEEIGNRLVELGKSPKECEQRYKYVREVLICKKK